MTIHRTSIVRVLGKFQRRTREEVGQTAVVLADPFMQEGVMVCPLGFFSHTHGAWVRAYPLADLDEVGDFTQDVVAGTIPRSYRPEYRIWAAMRRRCTDPTKWRGTNLLGKALDEAREVLRRA